MQARQWAMQVEPKTSDMGMNIWLANMSVVTMNTDQMLRNEMMPTEISERLRRVFCGRAEDPWRIGARVHMTIRTMQAIANIPIHP